MALPVYSRVLFVSKSEGALTADEVKRIFESSDDPKEVESAVKNAKDRLYASWASVNVIDKQRERIPIEDLAKQANTLIRRGGPISDEHTNRIVGKTVAYKLLEHPESGELGVLLLNHIYNDNKLDDEVWDEIKTGKRVGSSVGGVMDGTSPDTIERGGNRIDGFSWMETATTSSPVNPFATNIAYSVVAKSDSSTNDRTEDPDSTGPRTIITRTKGMQETEKAKYPWNQCISDQKEAGHSDEVAAKICGSIRAKYGEKGGDWYETAKTDALNAQTSREIASAVSKAAENEPEPSDESLSPEELALNGIENGDSAEDIIRGFVNSGLSFDEAKNAVVSAARAYDGEETTDDQREEYVSYVESLEPVDLGLSGSTAQEPEA